MQLSLCGAFQIRIAANLPTQNLPIQSYPTELLHLSLHSNPALHETKRHRGPG